MGVVLASVLVGAVLQRASGMGFAIVVAPFVVLALGPARGVVLVQLCGVAAAALVFARVRRDVDWTAYRSLLPTSLAGIVVGAFAIARLPEAPAQVVTALVLLVALAAGTVLANVRTVRRSAAVTAGAGVGAGFMTSVAGVGGVALTVLGQVTRWEQRSFAATLQPYFVSISSATVLARVATDPDAWPRLGALAWVGIGLAMAGGLLLGERAASRLSSSAARRLTLWIATLGAVLTLVDGIARW